MKQKTLTPSILINSVMLTLILLLTGQGDLLAAGEDNDLLVPGFGAGFNGKGYVQIDLNASPSAVAVQPDGKIVVGGFKNDNFWLARYKADGALDSDFGQNGEVITSFSTSGRDAISDVAIRWPFGEIVAVGSAEYPKKMAVAQYTADGRLVFQKTLNLSGEEEKARSVAIQPDGRIVMGGFAQDCGLVFCEDDEFAFVRLYDDGTLDSSFDNDGKKMIGLGTESEQVSRVLIQADGKIVGIGWKSDFIGGESRVGVVRLESNGRLDPTLDNDGKLNSAHIGSGWDGLVQADGKIVAVTTYGKMARYHPNGSVDAGFGPAGLVDLSAPHGAFATTNNIDIQIEFGANDHFLVAGQLESGERVVVSYTPQGHLDPSFNAGQGYVELPVTNFILDMAVGPDGRIVILQDGDYLTRLLPDGRLDRGEGRAFTNLSDSFEQIDDAVLQSDGKIVVTGEHKVLANRRLESRWVVARYTDGGHLDAGFGNAGLITDLDLYSSGRAAALDGQGRILVAGIVRTDASGSDFDFTLHRYLPDGRPAYFPAAANGRWPVTDIAGGYSDSVADMVVQPDNKIVLAGFTGFNNPPADFTLVRYLDNGAPDPNFGQGGKVVTDISEQGSRDFLSAMALQPDGKLLASGSTRSPGARLGSPVLVRYLPDGRLDPDFGGGDGKVTGPVPGSYLALAIQPDGKIVVGGAFHLVNGRRVFGAFRYTAAGKLDPAFNDGGQTLVDFGQDAVGTDLVLEPDGVISLTGCIAMGQDTPFAMVRLQPNGRPDGSFSGDGKATFDMGLNNDACAHSIVREAAGDYILAGYAKVTAFDDQFALAKVKGRGVTNGLPSARPNDYATPMDSPLTIAAPGVLDNDNDPEEQPLNAQLATPPENGELTLNSDGSFGYTPNQGFSGADRFTYRASDSFALSQPATVTIVVSAAGSTPTPDPNPGGTFSIYLPLVVK